MSERFRFDTDQHSRSTRTQVANVLEAPHVISMDLHQHCICGWRGRPIHAQPMLQRAGSCAGFAEVTVLLEYTRALQCRHVALPSSREQTLSRYARPF